MVNIGKKQFILGIFILVLGLGLVGCNKQPVVNENIDVNININSDEVDTSDWKTYKNEEYGFEFRHPGTLNLCIVGKSNRIVISDTTEEECVVVYNEKLSDFKIVITPAILDVEDDWIRWSKAGKGTIGETIENGITDLNGRQVYKSISESTGFSDQYSSVQIFTTYVVPSSNKNKLIEVSLLNRKEVNEDNIVILSSIVDSIIWK